MSANPNDALRRAVLEYLYELHRTHKGTRGHETEGRALTEAVRKRTGASLETIASDLRYLVETGFVRENRRLRTLSSGHQVDDVLYSIAGPGIQRIEGESEFMPQKTTSGVTVENRDGVVTVILGNGNRVSVGQNDLPAALAALAKIIESNRELSEAARRDALGDLETVRAQASKTKPDMGIISAAWEGVKIAVTAKEAALLLQQAAALLGLP